MALKKFFRKIFALAYDFFMSPVERTGLRKLRKKILRLVKGENVLELGVGTGLNIPVYPDGVKIIGVEPKFEMLERAIKRAKIFKSNVSFICASAEALPFEDEKFDTVFATFVFCEVNNPEKGFSEILRVLKSGGRLILLEHVRPDGKFASKIFDIANRFTSIFGENINRRTVELAQRSGIKIEKVENIYDGVVKLIVGMKP
ncbi:class I SAM-dependent methyltransferase [Candidatus Chrysopegis kryptomonas]|uniref:Demethylmenaquinone methyltransferase / 2-methoxy-6-polyprenyl-1,4-benzoquinol methylase n=1 Tax=Candidatus Chryseopegocella kryptomonas TaxID=1633643 RepID=A0A0P1MR84_9BACT|nr:class I SAM-dependent methyltransferase [Candidatus Chrysopegis kryptomonas]CUS98380.1 demethylmenaquinone methyltransferase / 2-methoxy-6-polyprenyl-1,4-benzoquinol methylase [Candidatus Chrysopegis kryptomonas]